MEQQTIRIVDLADGCAIAQVDEAIRRALENIADPNTDASAARAVVLKLTFKADQARTGVQVTFAVQTKTQGQTGGTAMVAIGRDKEGRVHAEEVRTHRSRTAELFDEMLPPELAHRVPSKPLMIHVASPISVALVGAANAPWAQRTVYAIAAPADRPRHLWGQFMPPEQFVIWLYTAFEAGADREEVLKLVGNLECQAVSNLADDGFTQRATARTGIARVAEVAVRNPVTLIPHRTFAEVAQPCGLFVLRLTGGTGPDGKKDGALPQVGLFEVADGRWRAAACEQLRRRLMELLTEAEITDLPVIL